MLHMVIRHAKSYLPSSISGSNASSNSTTQSGSGVTSNLQNVAGTAVETAKSVLSSAQQTIQPHLETAKQTVQPYVESAINAAQPHVEKLTGSSAGSGTAAPSDKPGEVPATTAPLQSGGGVMGGPYSETGKSRMADV